MHFLIWQWSSEWVPVQIALDLHAHSISRPHGVNCVFKSFPLNQAHCSAFRANCKCTHGTKETENFENANKYASSVCFGCGLILMLECNDPVDSQNKRRKPKRRRKVHWISNRHRYYGSFSIDALILRAAITLSDHKKIAIMFENATNK